MSVVTFRVPNQTLVWVALYVHNTLVVALLLPMSSSEGHYKCMHTIPFTFQWFCTIKRNHTSGDPFSCPQFYVTTAHPFSSCKNRTQLVQTIFCDKCVHIIGGSLLMSAGCASSWICARRLTEYDRVPPSRKCYDWHAFPTNDNQGEILKGFR